MLPQMGTEGRPTVVDVFAGPGGMGEGFRQAGFFIIAAVDNDKYACETLTRNAGSAGTLVIQNNVAKVNLTGKVDVVVGGRRAKGSQWLEGPKSAI